MSQRLYCFYNLAPPKNKQKKESSWSKIMILNTLVVLFLSSFPWIPLLALFYYLCRHSKQKTSALLMAITVGFVAAAFIPTSPTHQKAAATIQSTIESNEAPNLSLTPPRKICLMVEPTPFTYVSGYTNRFNEMLRYLSKAKKDHVVILTTDSVTPEAELPKEKYGYTIEHTKGFTLPLYEQMSMTFDLPQMKGASIIEKLKPDLIHASSP